MILELLQWKHLQTNKSLMTQNKTKQNTQLSKQEISTDKEYLQPPRQLLYMR